MDSLIDLFGRAQSGTDHNATEELNHNITQPNYENCLLEILTSPYDPNIYVFAASQLSRWAKINWMNLDFDHRQDFFRKITQLMFSNHPIAPRIADIFIDSAKQEKNFRALFEDVFFVAMKSIPNECNLDLLQVCATIVRFITEKYQTSLDGEFCEVSLLFSRIVDKLLPILNFDDLMHSEVGCEIVKNILKSFYNVFHRIQTHADHPLENESAAVINYAIGVLNGYLQGAEYPTTSIVAYCATFVYGILTDLQHDLSPLLEIVLQCLAKTDPDSLYELSRYLKILSLEASSLAPTFQTIALMLHIASLTASDLENFQSNPAVFYANVYSGVRSIDICDCDQHWRPRIAALSVVNILFHQDTELIRQFFENSTPSEVTMRCAAFCHQVINQEVLGSWTSAILANQMSNPVEVATLFFLLRVTIPLLPYETLDNLMGFATSALAAPEIVTAITACKLISALFGASISPTDATITNLIDFLPRCPTKHASDCMTIMAEYYPTSVQPIAETIMSGILERFASLPDDFDDDMISMIQKSFELMAKLINAEIKVGEPVLADRLIHPGLIELINRFLMLDDGEIFPVVADVIVAIVNSQSHEKIDAVIKSTMQALMSNQTAIGFIEDLARPFEVLAVANPAGFAEMGISDQLIMIALQAFDSFEDLIFGASDLICTVIQADSKTTVDPVIAFAHQILGMSNEEPYLLLATEMLISVHIAHDAPVEQDTFRIMQQLVHTGCVTRYVDKHIFLFASAFMGSKVPETAPLALAMCCSLMDQELQMKNDIEAYQQTLDNLNVPDRLKFAALDERKEKMPLELHNPVPLIKATMANCPAECLAQLAEQYPNQFTQTPQTQ